MLFLIQSLPLDKYNQEPGWGRPDVGRLTSKYFHRLSLAWDPDRSNDPSMKQMSKLDGLITITLQHLAPWYSEWFVNLILWWQFGMTAKQSTYAMYSIDVFARNLGYSSSMTWASSLLKSDHHLMFATFKCIGENVGHAIHFPQNISISDDRSMESCHICLCFNYLWISLNYGCSISDLILATLWCLSHTLHIMLRKSPRVVALPISFKNATHEQLLILPSSIRTWISILPSQSLDQLNTCLLNVSAIHKEIHDRIVSTSWREWFSDRSEGCFTFSSFIWPVDHQLNYAFWLNHHGIFVLRRWGSNGYLRSIWDHAWPCVVETTLSTDLV